MAHNFKEFPELANSQMPFYYWESPHKQILSDFSGIVTKVIDGDTIRVQWEERDFETVVRFLGNQAPEKKDDRGEEAKEFIEDLVLDEYVLIKVDPTNRVGKWGRILGTVFVDAINVNQEIINAGISTNWENRKAGKIPEPDDFFKRWEA